VRRQRLHEFRPAQHHRPDVSSYTDYSALSDEATDTVSAPSTPAGPRTQHREPHDYFGPPAAPTNWGHGALTKLDRPEVDEHDDRSDRAPIERCQGSGCTNFVQVAALAGTATTFTNSGLLARTTYRYRVRAHNALGDSSYSNTASARTKG
jgi:hypothetical protein